MKLKVLLPTEVLLEEDGVLEVIAEADNGYFGLKPRHVDFTAILVPGLLAYYDADGRETFLAVDRGVLTKVGSRVLVSVRNGVKGPSLGRLREIIRDQFSEIDQRDRRARTAAARIEAGFVRKFLDLSRNA
jgi:F-type H+-transporting ATPase subunit epsilon